MCIRYLYFYTTTQIYTVMHITRASMCIDLLWLRSILQIHIQIISINDIPALYLISFATYLNSLHIKNSSVFLLPQLSALILFDISTLYFVCENVCNKVRTLSCLYHSIQLNVFYDNLYHKFQSSASCVDLNVWYTCRKAYFEISIGLKQSTWSDVLPVPYYLAWSRRPLWITSCGQ